MLALLLSIAVAAPPADPTRSERLDAALEGWPELGAEARATIDALCQGEGYAEACSVGAKLADHDGDEAGERAYLDQACALGAERSCLLAAAEDSEAAATKLAAAMCAGGSATACGWRATDALVAGAPYPDALRGWLREACEQAEKTHCFNWAEWELMHGNPGWASMALEHVPHLPDSAVLQLRLCAEPSCASEVHPESGNNDWSAYRKSMERAPDGALHGAVVDAVVAGDSQALDAALAALARQRSDKDPFPVRALKLHKPLELRRPGGTQPAECPVRVVVAPSGQAEAVDTSLCPEPLASALGAALKEARWLPYRIDGEPVRAASWQIFGWSQE